jgi:hypothetical protein
MRVWIWCVTVFAVGVAAYELAQLFGWQPPLSEIAVSAILVTTLLAVFAWIFVSLRSLERSPMIMEQTP